MKKVIILLFMMIILMGVQANAINLGIKKATEFINLPLIKPLDSSGWTGLPDSAHIITYADNGSAKSFSTRSTTYPFSDISIDTTKDYGDTCYFFVDQIQDIDGTAGNFTLGIIVKLWYKKLPTTTIATVQVIADSLNMYLVDINDTVNALMDTAQNQDDWVAKEASLFDPTSDSVIVDVSSAQVTDGLLAVGADTTWEEILTGGTHNTATSAGRRLRTIDAAFVLATGTAQVSATPTDPGTYIILAAATSEADDHFNHASVTIDGGTGIGQSRAIADYTGATDSAALILGDDWITDPDATSTYVISPGHPVEVITYHGNTALDQIHEYDSSNVSGAAAMGTVIKNNSIPSDTNINGDTIAVVGTDQIMRLRGFHVKGTTALDTAMIAWGQTSGQGFNIVGGSVATGLFVEGFGGSPAFNVKQAASGIGFNITGNGSTSNANGMKITGGASGYDILLAGTNKVISDGTNTVFMTNNYEDLWDEVSIGCIVEDSTGNTTTMLQTNLAEATDNHYNGAMVMFIDGTEARTWRRITDYDGGNGYIVFDPAVLTAPAAGDSMRIMPWASVSATATISDGDMGAIADSVWDIDTTDAFAVAAGVGKFLKDSTQGAAAGITVDAIWEYDTANISGAQAVGSMLKDTTVYQNVTAINGDAAAADSLEAWLDGYANTQLTNREQIFVSGDFIDTILDSTVAMLLHQRAYADTMIYGHCVWVDAGANTNTVVGVDGVPSNPVGTIAAAKTIADALGIVSICLLDGANETIGETMEHYYFFGLTRSAVINLGGQDVDYCFFENLTVTGEQGGTETIVVINSGLSNADSLEIHARYCAIINNLSLRAGDQVFYACYSSVAGNATPVLDFADVGAAVNVNWRLYSGGLELQNMTTNHTISFEALGQVIINANSDNGNITARGPMSLTDNGTSMNITDDAVWNRTAVSTPITDTVNAILDTLQDRTGCEGSGSDTVTYYVIDTANADTLPDVSIWMKTWAGQDYGGTQLTNASGFVTILASTNDTLRVFARKLGYVFEIDTLIFAAQGADSLVGFVSTIAGSGGDSTIRIYGYAKDVISNLKQGAIPTATLVDRGFSVDTCNDIPIVQKIVTGTASNSSGLWEVYLIKSKCYKKAGIYEIKLRYKTYDEQIYRDTIPGDSSSYQIKGRRFGD